MRTIRALALVLVVPCALAVAQGTAQPPAVAPPPYRMIVHARSSMTTLERDFVADAFLKKTTRWKNGDTILPVDLSGDSPVRRKFSEEVLSRSAAAVRSYWQQLIFSGRDVPPPELDSDADVVKYVSKHAGAIGYVSGSGDVAGAKVVTVK